MSTYVYESSFFQFRTEWIINPISVEMFNSKEVQVGVTRQRREAIGRVLR